MIDVIREKFEEIVYPSFAGRYNLNKKNNGEYAADVIEDHWQTFQEGWEAAIEYLKQSRNNYTDTRSSGGMDPRDRIDEMCGTFEP